MTTGATRRRKQGKKAKKLAIYVTIAAFNAIESASIHAGASSISEWCRQKLIQGLKINRPLDELEIPRATPLSGG